MTTCLRNDMLASRGLALDSVHFAYKGKPIDSLCVSHLMLRALGPVAIEPKDFNGFPIRVMVNGPRLLEATVPHSVRDRLHLESHLIESGIELMPCLLNAGDEVTLDIVTIGAEPHFSIESRITDVEAVIVNLDLKEPPDPLQAIWFLMPLALMIWFAACSFGKGYVGRSKEGLIAPKRSWLVTISVCMYCSAALILIFVIRYFPDQWVQIMLPAEFSLLVTTWMMFRDRNYRVYKEIHGVERDQMAAGYLFPTSNHP